MVLKNVVSCMKESLKEITRVTYILHSKLFLGVDTISKLSLIDFVYSNWSYYGFFLYSNFDRDPRVSSTPMILISIKMKKIQEIVDRTW